MSKGTHSRPPRSAFIPLRVTAHLAAPVVGDPSLPLDGILYYHAMRERYGPQLFTESGQDHSARVTGVSLPILRHDEHGPLWYYACSWAQWPASFAQNYTHWNKRLPADRLQFLTPQRGRVDTKSGRYKAYHMPIYYRHAASIYWYMVAEPAWLARMLGYCTHVGKKTDQGWGAVSRWEVEQIEQDWSVRDASGNLARAIPANSGPLYGFRPSYWLRKNQAPCQMPEF